MTAAPNKPEQHTAAAAVAGCLKSPVSMAFAAFGLCLANGDLMNLLALHVYHLDDGPEADAVIALLTEAGIGPEWHIERPNEANAILLPIELQDRVDESWQVRQRKLELAVARLCMLRPEPLGAIRQMQLSTAMRIHTREFYLPLPANFVRECGRLGLEICILNEAAGD
jgi:hypothetical protein